MFTLATSRYALFNTFAARLIQVIRTKTAGSHVT